MKPETHPTHWTEDREALARRLIELPRLLVASDFDGTLAEIAPTPAEAVLAPGAAAVLEQMAGLPGVLLAIVSGRALDDLAGRIPVGSCVLVGNHGLEMRGLALDGEPATASAHREQLAALMAQVDRLLGATPGVLIENKGLTGSVHYRNVPPAYFSEVVNVMSRIVASHEAFELGHGKMVWEIKPRIAWHKGSALRQILGRLDQSEASVLYLGDDTTDEFVFQTLPGAVTLHVGPPGATAARWRAEDPTDAVAFLNWLVAVRKHGVQAGSPQPRS